MTAPIKGPSALAAERALLGLVLLDKARLVEAAEMVRATDFEDERHAALLPALVELEGEGCEFALLALQDGLKRKGALQAVGGVAYLGELQLAGSECLDSLEDLARIVADKGAKRRTLVAMREAAERIQQDQAPSGQILADAQAQLSAIGEGIATGDMVPLNEVLAESVDVLTEMRQHRGGITGVRTGLHDLDSMLTGLHPGELLILAARPGQGKTSLAVNAAIHVALADKKAAAIFSLEMARDQLGLRILASEGRVSLKRLREGGFTDHDISKINQATNRLMGLPVYLEDMGGLNPMDIRARLGRLKRRLEKVPGGPQLGLVVVDYLQLMDGSGERQYSREQEVAHCSRALKSMSKEFKVPVLALAQLGRKAEERKGRPMLSDLRESGSIEADADVVMFLCPEERGDDDKAEGARPGCDLSELVVAKQRNGPTGVVPLNFFPEWTRFESRTRGEEQGDVATF